jgi:hypothetical protein
MEAGQHSLLAACFTLHSINATLAIVPQRGAGLWILYVTQNCIISELSSDILILFYKRKGFKDYLTTLSEGGDY